MRALCLSLLVLALAAHTVPLAQASPALAADDTPPLQCTTIPGADALLQPGQILLLGEIHGTRQAPQAVEDLACAAAGRDLDVTVALEFPQSEAPRVATYLASDGTLQDQATLIDSDFWQRDYQDGRGSEAMLQLVEALRRLQQQTLRVEVMVIDNPVAPQGRDLFMAQWLKLAIQEQPDRLYVSLTGNLHNRMVRMGNGFEPMGYHLQRLLPEASIHALNVTYDDGTAWVCAAGEACQVLTLRGQGAAAPGVALYPALSEQGYTGQLHVGSIEASVPAKQTLKTGR